MERTAMTKINYSEYNQLVSFDQCLVWAVTTLAAANRHPENKDLLSQPTIRPEAVDYVTWQVQTDAEGQPYLTISALFPLLDYSPLTPKYGLVAKIPNYTDFQPPAEPLVVTAAGQGLPKPPIPPEIDTLERLCAWLCLIANQLGEYIDYLNLLQYENHRFYTSYPAPERTIDSRGLTYTKPVSIALLKASNRTPNISTETTAAAAFDKLSGDPPEDPRKADLQEKLDEAAEQQRANSEPPTVSPSKGYERIDTLPSCKDQDPSLKAFNSKSLAALIK
jgi:hypothetical protein